MLAEQMKKFTRCHLEKAMNNKTLYIIREATPCTTLVMTIKDIRGKSMKDLLI